MSTHTDTTTSNATSQHCEAYARRSEAYQMIRYYRECTMAMPENAKPVASVEGGVL